MKKILLLILAIALIIGLVNSPTRDEPYKVVSFCNDIQNESAKNKCYSEKAFEEMDFKLCEKINKSESFMAFVLRSGCYSNLSRINHDAELCENIVPDDGKNICYHHLARNKEDEKICEQISDSSEKDYCYLNMASIKKDSDLCEKITKFTTTKDLCYLTLAIEKQNITLCKNIDLFNKFNFRRDCYLNASIEKSQKACDSLIHIDEKDECYATVATDSKLCEKIVSQSPKDWCYWNLATTTNNQALCTYVNGSFLKNLCDKGFGLASKS